MNDALVSALRALLAVWGACEVIVLGSTMALYVWGRVLARRHATWGWHVLSVLPILALAVHVGATVGALSQILPALEPALELLRPAGYPLPPRSYDLAVANSWTIFGQSAALLLYFTSFVGFARASRPRPGSRDPVEEPAPYVRRPPNRP